MDGYSIKCSGHTYVTLTWNGKFIFCLDNDVYYAEEIIYRIEQRTHMDFASIPIDGNPNDFQGLRFFYGGWKRKFWGDFPSESDIKGYMNLKEGLFK